MTEPQIFAFDSMEEVFAMMADSEAKANASLHAKQIDLRDRTDETVYWVRPHGEFMIFGDTPSVADTIAIERTYYGTQMDDEEEQEFEYVKASLVTGRQRGYLNGRCFSIIEPTGELGNTHVASVWPISKQAFEEAKAADWKPTPEQSPTLVEDMRSLLEARQQ